MHTTRPSRLTSSFLCWSMCSHCLALIGKSSSYHLDCTQNPQRAHAFCMMGFDTSCTAHVAPQSYEVTRVSFNYECYCYKISDPPPGCVCTLSFGCVLNSFRGVLMSQHPISHFFTPPTLLLLSGGTQAIFCSLFN
jgi:hypothetical protein